MLYIMPNITSLQLYKNLIHNKQIPRLEKCPCGKLGPQKHGTYDRKADRTNSVTESLNPIKIQRYYCPDCKKTFSVLPECIPPRRWYLWRIQQLALLSICLSNSFSAAQKKLFLSRQTVRRWYRRFEEQFALHKDTLCSLLSELGQVSRELKIFWQETLEKICLGGAMRLCHVAGVVIP
jgi:transposase-like protein